MSNDVLIPCFCDDLKISWHLMSSKACKRFASEDTLLDCSGVQIKTRKRNIAVALDPGSFANAVVVCFEDARESNDLEKNLQSAVKVCFHPSSILKSKDYAFKL